MALAAALILPGTTAIGQSFWSGGTSDFNNAASWSGTYIGSSNPNCANDSGSNNVVLIEPGDPVWQHGDTLAGQTAGSTGAYLQTGSTNNTGGGNWMRLGIGTGGTVGYYTLSNGVVNVGGQTHIGENGTGYIEVDGGTYNANGGNPGICAGDGDFGVSTGTLTLNAGTINNMNGNETWFGEALSGCTGYLFMNGGTFNANNWFVFGRNGGNGYGVVTGGTINFTGGGQFLVGGGGIGSLIQSGGTINVFNQYLVPQSNGSGSGSGTNVLSGTAVLNVHDWLAVGRNNGHGEMDISGNAVVTRDNGTDSGSHFDIGASAVGVLNQNGGIITNTASALYIGENGAGTWNFNAGTAILGNVTMCLNSSASGILNLNGGLFQTAGIASPQPSAVSELNWNAATLQANANNANFIAGLFQASVGPGAIIDSQGYTIAIPQTLNDNGGGTLTKLGTGTLTLTGANNYSGATTVSAGTLITGTSSSASASTGYTIADNAGFGVLVQSAGGQFNVSSVSLGTSTGGTLDFNLGSFGNPTGAPLNISGAFTAHGTITVNISASVLAVGTIPLVQYGSLVGSPTYLLASLPAGVVAHLTTAGNTLELIVTSAGAPRWNGNVTGAWDLGTNQDWIDLGTLLPVAYSDGKPVVFDDNATGTTTVNVSATVAPASITFTNNSLPYSLVGTGQISGSTGISLNGSGTVSILNTGGNTFTGPVIVNGGVLDVTNLANGGSPSPLGASSASPGNLVINQATFEYSGAPVTANRGFTLGATNSTIDAEGNLTLGGNVSAATNIVGGGSAFTKVGPALLTLTGSGDNEFANGFNPGGQVQNGTLVLDGSAGGQTNHSQNDFYVGDTTAVGASMILTNTTLHVDGWLGVGRINGGINNTSSITLYNSTVTCGNMTIGWDGGQAGNLSSQFFTMNGNSVVTNFGTVNLNEGTGSTMTMSLNGNSVYWVQNPVYIATAASSTGSVVVANSAQMISVNGWFDIANGNNSVASMVVKNNAGISTVGDFNVTDGGTGATANFLIQDNATLHANNLWVGKATGVTATMTITNNATVVSANGLTMSTHFDGTPEVTTSTLNLSGGSLAVNLIQGNSVSGVYYGVFNFNGGLLISKPTSGYSGQDFMFNLGAINVQSGGAFIEIDGTQTNDIHQPLLGGNGDGGLTKLGTGTLFLNAVNTYTNTTTISNGALGGTGTIAGPVKVASGGALVAGAGAIGTFNINNTLTFASGSTSLMKITPASNDQIAGLTGVTYGGALVVTNTSASPLVVGHTYTLFNSAAAGTGNFSSVTVLPSGGATFNPSTGVLTITSVGNGLAFNPVKTSGGSLILTGTGGTAGGGYTLLTTTNLTTPLANWTTNTTGTLDGNGAFSNAVPVNPAQPVQFFRVRAP